MRLEVVVNSFTQRPSYWECDGIPIVLHPTPSGGQKASAFDVPAGRIFPLELLRQGSEISRAAFDKLRSAWELEPAALQPLKTEREFRDYCRAYARARMLGIVRRLADSDDLTWTYRRGDVLTFVGELWPHLLRLVLDGEVQASLPEDRKKLREPRFRHFVDSIVRGAAKRGQDNSPVE
jgi:hypothetical protein